MAAIGRGDTRGEEKRLASRLRAAIAIVADLMMKTLGKDEYF